MNAEQLLQFYISQTKNSDEPTITVPRPLLDNIVSFITNPTANNISQSQRNRDLADQRKALIRTIKAIRLQAVIRVSTMPWSMVDGMKLTHVYTFELAKFTEVDLVTRIRARLVFVPVRRKWSELELPVVRAIWNDTLPSATNKDEDSIVRPTREPDDQVSSDVYFSYMPVDFENPVKLTVTLTYDTTVMSNDSITCTAIFDLIV